MRFLRTNTATRITVGPFLDKSDGITPETALTVTACKLTFMVDNAGVPTLILDTNPTASAGVNDMVHVTGDDAGFYDLELAAADVNYVGRAMLALTDAATHCPVFHEFMILSAQAFDAMCGTGNFKVDVDTIKTQTVTCDAGVTVPSSIASPTNITAGTITTVTNLTNAPTVGDLTATMKTSVTTAATAATPIAASVTGAVGSVTGLTASDVGAIKAKTDNLPTDPADQSLVIAATDVITALIGTPVGVSLSADVAAVKVDSAAILDDTGTSGVKVDLTQTVTGSTGKPSTIGALLFFIRQAWQNKLNYNKGTNTMILYEDDSITAKLTHAMTDDASVADRGKAT